MEVVLIFVELLVLVASSMLVGMWVIDPNGNYEPIIVGLSLILGALEVYRRNNITRKSVNSRDVELFEAYKEMMFTNGLISILEQHDFLSPLHMTTWHSLVRFVEKGDDIDHQFTNKKLNKSYLKAHEAAFEFGGLISKYTVPMNPPMNDQISIYGVGYKEKPIKDHERLQAVEINEAGKAFVKAQKEFVVLGNRLLY